MRAFHLKGKLYIYLMAHGFDAKTLHLLNRDNLEKLAAEYGYQI